MVLSLGLSACGYQLRGDNDKANLPSQISVYADDQQLANTTVEILNRADVATTLSAYSSTADSAVANVAGMRFTNTKTSREGVIHDANGNTTHWRYSVSTEMLLGTGDNSKTFKLQEYQQIELNTASGAGSTNDRIVASTWQELYQAIAQQAVRILGKQP